MPPSTTSPMRSTPRSSGFSSTVTEVRSPHGQLPPGAVSCSTSHAQHVAGEPTMSDIDKSLTAEEMSRRTLLAGVGAVGAGLAAFAAGAGKPVYAADQGPARKLSGPTPKAPFDSMRDWVAALEANGLLMRFKRIDQDKYEIPGLFFRATDQYGMYGAPTMLFEEVKIDGKWMKGPVLVNLYGHWNTDAIVWNLPVVPGDHYATYNGAVAYLKDMLAKNRGKYPELPPVEIPRGKAPCKEVVLKGDEIDLLKFPFVKTNPADGGRYVNTGSHFMVDAKLGANFGTYRAEIKGPRKLGINIEPNQTGDKFLKAAQKRGEKVVKYSIVLGQDPLVWLLSGTRLAPRFTDEPQDE
ncbi:MAG: UbiD family decarboxylase, partial [Gammaproteobacteria bacterium]|nr:UbiD family decarboxylase [Gammaproteobacteria bacterium]